MPTMDQVAWANANVTVGGETTPFSRGSLLPEPTSPEEAAERSTLRLIGAVRTVEVVYTAEELAEQARQRGTVTAAREAALDVDPAAPMSAQVPGSVQPGPPTMIEPSGSPVVIGDEDLRAETEKAQAEADQRAEQAQARPPAPGAAKSAWADFAVTHRGLSRDEADKLSRDQLASRYSEPAQDALMDTAQGRAAQAAGEDQGTSGQQERGASGQQPGTKAQQEETKDQAGSQAQSKAAPRKQGG